MYYENSKKLNKKLFTEFKFLGIANRPRVAALTQMRPYHLRVIALLNLTSEATQLSLGNQQHYRLPVNVHGQQKIKKVTLHTLGTVRTPIKIKHP